MTLATDQKPTKPPRRPFLVLPLLGTLAMPKNPNLKLFTKTWPPKRDGKGDDRPLTATLDKPAVLNISLMGLIDMSTVRKEFLNISNLCKFPLALSLRRKKAAAAPSRPLSLPSPEKHKPGKHKARKNKNRPESEDCEDEESSLMSIQSAKTKIVKSTTAKVKKVESLMMKKKSVSTVTTVSSDANNNNSNNKTVVKIPRKRVVNVKLLEVSKSGLKSTKLPEPCKTCGRPDQPERFHSHPATPLKITKKPEEPPKMKSTVQKPVAMKYKSKQSGGERKPPPPPPSSLKKPPPPPAQKLLRTPPPKPDGTPRVKSAKRTLTCYICGREFGTASLHLHEPRCLQKWERENAGLPAHMQRKPPVKPDHDLTPEEWNKFAWEASQATLTPCKNCGRTFYPDRLLVHQRSCKTPHPHENSKSSVEKSAPPSPMVPPSAECYICGKMFGTHSIKIHEKQCLKKWHAENDSLPPDIRAPEPVKKDPLEVQEPESSSQRSGEKEERPASAKKSPMFPCYICGRLFTVNSIYIHEPQCLKMWKVENEKLPASKRRPQPIKPDVKFTQEGKIDYEATNEAKWQSHLSQLVACQFCARTFNPDRVDVHERSCKG